MAGEAHWIEEAKALISGLILEIVARETSSRRNLGTLREYLTLAPDHFAALLKRMQETDEAGGLIARAANRHLGKSDREAASVLFAAQRHTHFLDSPRMITVLSHSDFLFADLKRRNVLVFLVPPPDCLSTYSRWLRLIVSQSLTDMARDPAKPANPVLYLLDEFAALGDLALVEPPWVSWQAIASSSGQFGRLFYCPSRVKLLCPRPPKIFAKGLGGFYVENEAATIRSPETL